MRASQKGNAPEFDVTHGAPPGFMVRGTSTLYDGDGNVVMQWHKTKEDWQEQWEALKESVAGLLEDLPARLPNPKKSPKFCDTKLLVLYPEGDPHWGMRVWGEETGGESYDLDIAMREYRAATDYLVGAAPPASEALVLNIGDLFHADNPESRTRRSGHSLQVDGRLPKVFRTVLEARAYRIDRCLEKHKVVRVREVIGNHDEVMGLGFTQALKAYYRNEPRVIIEDSPREFWYYRFGQCLFGATHGHKLKLDDMGMCMATDVPDLWGATKHRHFYTGHQHHLTRKETRGVIVEMLRTLAARNEFEDSHGYRSGQEMLMRVYHQEYGEVATTVMGWDLLRALLDAAPEAA